MKLPVLLVAALFALAPATVEAQLQTPPTRQAPATRQAPVPTPANQFASEADAKQRCGSDMVVWVNLSSRIYHYAGYKDYGKTKRGAYMCKAEAERAGNKDAKNEKQKA